MPDAAHTGALPDRDQIGAAAGEYDACALLPTAAGYKSGVVRIRAHLDGDIAAAAGAAALGEYADSIVSRGRYRSLDGNADRSAKIGIRAQCLDAGGSRIHGAIQGRQAAAAANALREDTERTSASDEDVPRHDVHLAAIALGSRINRNGHVRGERRSLAGAIVAEHAAATANGLRDNAVTADTAGRNSSGSGCADHHRPTIAATVSGSELH